MKMIRRLVFAAIALGLATGCPQQTNTPAAQANSPPAKSAPFLVVRAEKKAIPRPIEQPGSIHAFESAPIHAKLAGHVKRVAVDLGDKVEMGAVLIELNVPELDDDVRQKQALVERARSRVEQAKKQVAIAEANVIVAEASVAETKASLDRAQASVNRWASESKRVEALVRSKVVDAQTADETLNQLRSAEASMDEARSRRLATEKLIVKAQAELEKAKEDVSATGADVRVAESDLARARTMLAYCTIKAPFAGSIATRAVDAGHFVQAPTTTTAPLLSLVRTDTVRVAFDVPEADAPLVKVGTKATVRIAATRAEIAAEVKRTSAALDPTARTLRTEIDLPNPDGKLRPGTYVQVKLLAEMPTAWALPASSVVKQADQTVCFVLRDGKAVRLPIQSGRTDGTMTEVFKKQSTPGTWIDWTGEETILSGPGCATLTDGQAVETTAK